MYAKMYALFETNPGTPPPGGCLNAPWVCAYESTKKCPPDFSVLRVLGVRHPHRFLRKEKKHGTEICANESGSQIPSVGRKNFILRRA